MSFHNRSREKFSQPSNDGGYTLVDLLVGTTIALMVLTLGLTALKTEMVSTDTIARVSEEQRALIRTYNILNFAFDSLETHRSHWGHKINQNGELTLADGSPHPIMRSKTTSLPRRDSVILSVAALASERSATIRSITNVGSRLEIHACYNQQLPQNQSPIRSYLLRSVEGVMQVAGIAEGAGASCFHLSATPVQSIFSAQRRSGSWQQIIPLRNEFSIYVDHSSQVRLMTHVGALILDNQPLVRGVHQITCRESSLGGPEIVASRSAIAFDVTLRAASDRSISWQRIIALPREELWNGLFNG